MRKGKCKIYKEEPIRIFQNFNRLDEGILSDKVEKLKIVGRLIGRKSIQEERIYQHMLHINDMNEKITISKLAKLLNTILIGEAI